MSDDKEWRKKQREYEQKKARTKLALNVCTICGKKGGHACKGCGTLAYCSTECQRIDWRDRGHRKACKKIQDERAAEAARAEARAEAPTPPPSPPREVFYGPAPRSHADEVRARIAAEHEAARALREANPEREPLLSARYGSCCPICLEDWDVNQQMAIFTCCFRMICTSCAEKVESTACPFCAKPVSKTNKEELAEVRRHVEDELPEAIVYLGNAYRDGEIGVVKSMKKAAKLYKRAVELGDLQATFSLASMYYEGDGVKLDKKKARQLYQMAADRGHARAQHNIGSYFHREGQQEEAIRYFKMAAEQGLTPAEFNVGLSNEKGIGVERDLDEAKRWYARAAAKGDERAIEALAKLAPA